MWLCHDGEISSSVIFVTVKRFEGGGGWLGSVMCARLGCKARVGVYSLLSYPAVVCPFSMSNAQELCLWLMWIGEKEKNKTRTNCQVL